MCSTLKGEYNESLSRYEFIALNSPNLTTRLMACLDYTSVYSNINGYGGSVKTSKIKKLKKFEDIKPINKIIRQTFEKSLQNNLISSDIKFDKSQKNREDSEIKNILNKTRNLSSKQKIKFIDDKGLKIINKNYFNKKTISNSNKNSDNITLLRNYPNPFNPNTIINYQLQMSSDVTLKVFDILGNEVASLVNGKQNAGSYEVEFNGANLSSGIYFYTLKAEGFSETKRMLLLK